MCVCACVRACVCDVCACACVCDVCARVMCARVMCVCVPHPLVGVPRRPFGHHLSQHDNPVVDAAAVFLLNQVVHLALVGFKPRRGRGGGGGLNLGLLGSWGREDGRHRGRGGKEGGERGKE